MKEPYLSEFSELVRGGAGTLDIHDTAAQTPYTREIQAPPVLVERELALVERHCNSLNVLLEHHVGQVSTIVDVGCGTGATAVAMALSPVLSANKIIGVDPNKLSIRAAEIRALGYDLDRARCEFRPSHPSETLPVADASADLTTCISVLEYIHDDAQRARMIAELKRVTRPGGYILLATPNPMRLRERHTKRILGDWRRREGYPWSSPPWRLLRMFHDCQFIPSQLHQLRHGLSKRGVPGRRFPSWLGWLGWLLPWQKILVRKQPAPL